MSIIDFPRLICYPGPSTIVWTVADTHRATVYVANDWCGTPGKFVSFLSNVPGTMTIIDLSIVGNLSLSYVNFKDISFVNGIVTTDKTCLNGGNTSGVVWAIKEITMTQLLLENVIYHWVSEVLTELTSGRIIWDKQNIPRPAKGYVSLSILSQKDIGEPGILSPDISGMSEIISNTSLTLSIQYFGEYGMDILTRLKQSLRMPKYLVGLQTNNIAFVNDDDIQDITTLLDTMFEPRASYQVVFRYAQITIDDSIGVIEHVNGTKTFKNPNITHILTV